MKIMPIMTAKNDCLQKQQCKTHTPAFNGKVTIKGMESYGDRPLEHVKFFIRQANEAFRQVAGKNAAKVLGKKNVKIKKDGRIIIIIKFPKKFNDVMRKLVPSITFLFERAEIKLHL